MDSFLYALIMFMVVEYSTGLLCCIIGKRPFCNSGFKALFRKITILCLVGITNILDRKIFETGTVMRTSIILFYLSNEGISILENAICMGVPVPKKIRQMIAQLQRRQS
nr:phage holin family protein [Selenomonas noxia]